jgi:tetratricopeptide (TPR) repeat protein
VLVYQGRNEEALEQIKQTLTVNPDYLPGKAMQAMVYWYLGRYEEGNSILEQFSWTRAYLAWGYAMAGRREEARAIFEELSASPHPATFDLAILCLLLEDLDGALIWLEKAWNERDNKLYVLRAALERNEVLRPYRAEPRLQTFLARIAPRAASTNADLVVTAAATAREG